MEHMEETQAGAEEQGHPTPHTLTHPALIPPALTPPALALSTSQSQGLALPPPALGALLQDLQGRVLGLDLALGLVPERLLALGLALLEEGWVGALHHLLQSLPSYTGSHRGTSG